MKRKSIVTICAIALMFVLSFSALTACNKNKHDFSSEWKNDEKYHWHECVIQKHTDIADKADHAFDAGVVTKETTEAEEGVKTLTCMVCGYQKTKTISQLGHTFDTNNWKYDDDNHWHPATCDHKDEKSETAPHEWNDGEISTPANYGVEGVKTYTCVVCKAIKTETIVALEAKNNVISFANDLVKEKTYDGLEFIIDPAKVNRHGDGKISITYKGENDTAFSTNAPINAGEYTVKATVNGTAEWKGGEITTTILINKRELTLPADVFERKHGENLESGKFGLACINVVEETNNVVEWVTIGAPETYYAIGMHTIDANVLTVDNDNFELNKGAYDTVRFTIWDAPSSFYAGIQDLLTLPGSSDVIITTKIANGTVNTGDQLLVNEIGKIITVKKIEKGIGMSATIVETANAGDEVGLRIEGAKKTELNRGYMLSKPDTVIGYSKITATIRMHTKEEGNKAPIATGNKVVAFADTFGEITGTVTLPEGIDMVKPGEMQKDVTINFQGKKVPAFVGRKFTLKSSGKTIAECIITAVPQATRVRSGRMFGNEGNEFIEPIELGEKTFAVNLSRSDVGVILKNAKNTDDITIDFYANGKTIGKYRRTPGTGEEAYNEVGSKVVGSYLIVDLFGNAGGNLADYTSKWIFTGEDVFIGINVIVKPGSGT